LDLLAQRPDLQCLFADGRLQFADPLPQRCLAFNGTPMRRLPVAHLLPQLQNLR
jgi:hypothetical protein